MERGHAAEGSIIWRAVRIVVPWVALVIVVTALWSLVVDYRAAVEQRETSATVEATGTATIGDGLPYVRVISDGLNMRAEPSTAASVLKVLDAEQRLEFIEEATGWYHVRDAADGAEGWVAAGGSYTQLVQP